MTEPHHSVEPAPGLDADWYSFLCRNGRLALADGAAPTATDATVMRAELRWEKRIARDWRFSLERSKARRERLLAKPPIVGSSTGAEIRRRSRLADLSQVETYIAEAAGEVARHENRMRRILDLGARFPGTLPMSAAKCRVSRER